MKRSRLIVHRFPIWPSRWQGLILVGAWDRRARALPLKCFRCGGKSEMRVLLAIHRGRGVKWEVVFRENDTDVVTTTTSDLQRMTNTMLSWLGGRSLAADEDSVHAVAG